MSTETERRKAKQCSELIQVVMRLRGIESVTAVEAARWLDAVELLKDSRGRPGKPLRDLLRAKLIEGQSQAENRRWKICRLK